MTTASNHIKKTVAEWREELAQQLAAIRTYQDLWDWQDNAKQTREILAGWIIKERRRAKSRRRSADRWERRHGERWDLMDAWADRDEADANALAELRDDITAAFREHRKQETADRNALKRWRRSVEREEARLASA